MPDEILPTKPIQDNLRPGFHGISRPLAQVGLQADLLVQLADLRLQLGDAFHPFGDVLDVEQGVVGEIGNIRDRNLRTESTRQGMQDEPDGEELNDEFHGSNGTFAVVGL